jgi:hypothetical protein
MRMSVLSFLANVNRRITRPFRNRAIRTHASATTPTNTFDADCIVTKANAKIVQWLVAGVSNEKLIARPKEKAAG